MAMGNRIAAIVDTVAAALDATGSDRDDLLELALNDAEAFLERYSDLLASEDVRLLAGCASSVPRQRRDDV